MIIFQKINITLITILAVFTTYSAQVTISGTAQNAPKEYLYVKTFNGNDKVLLDSLKLSKKGTFKGRVEVEKENFYTLEFDEKEYALFVLSPATKNIIFNVDANNFTESYEIKGNQQSEDINKLTAEVYKFKTAQNELSKKMYSSQLTDEQKGEVQKEADKLRASFNTERNKFIENNYNKLAGLVVTGYLQPTEDEDLEYLRKIEKGFGETMPNSFYHNGLKAQLAQIETQIQLQKEAEAKKLAQEKKTAIGAVAPELDFPSPDGEIITLESLRGNYVLIDFWASWCRPCRMENPNVVKMYNKYKDDGFTVYSVSLDKDKSRWKQAILADGLAWPNHVSDLKQWQTEATKIYGFGGIPYTVLLDKEGKIVAKKLRGPALEQKLEEIFGH